MLPWGGNSFFPYSTEYLEADAYEILWESACNDFLFYGLAIHKFPEKKPT